MVVFGQKLFYSGKSSFIWESGCIRSKVVVFGQSGSIGAKKLYSGKLVVFGQSGCFRAG